MIHYEIDLGFVVNPVRHRDLVLKKIGSDRVGFWRAVGAQPGNRIFADANLTQVQELLGKKMSARFKHWQVVETPSLELIRSLVASGAGIGILPRANRQRGWPAPGICRSFPSDQARRDLYGLPNGHVKKCRGKSTDRRGKGLHQMNFCVNGTSIGVSLIN